MDHPLSEHAVLEFIEAWSVAERHGDCVALDRLLAADFVGVGPRGFVRTRDEWLGRYSSGTMRNTVFELTERPRIRLYGETAVAVVGQTQQSINNGNDASGDFRFTLVVVRQAGRPFLAGVHVSPYAGPRDPLGAGANAVTGGGSNSSPAGTRSAP